MRGLRRFVDWLPTLLASMAVLAKLLALATVWSGSVLTVPLLAFIIADFIPFKLAEAAKHLFFDAGISPARSQVLFQGVVMLVLTAVQWYVVGAIVRRWVLSGETPAVTTRFR